MVNDHLPEKLGRQRPFRTCREARFDGGKPSGAQGIDHKSSQRCLVSVSEIVEVVHANDQKFCGKTRTRVFR